MKIKCIVGALWSVSAALALSNAVTITNQSGGQQTNRVITIPRYFANGEICEYPQPHIGGSAVTYWQADVRNRWPADTKCAAGYVKFALITIERTIPDSGSIRVEFRNALERSSGGAGLDKAGMLSFNGGAGPGVWPSRGAFTQGGITFTTSAKNMIANDFYKVLESGPLRTSVLVREGPEALSGAATRTTAFGWRCTSNCVAPYSPSGWSDDPLYHSIRPSFVITFYQAPSQGTGTVETDFLLDNGWMDRAQDQRIESAVLYRDDSGEAACYTAPAPFVIPFRSRLFETCWSAEPASVHIDLNFPYLYYSKVIPAYGPEYTVSAAAEALETAGTDGGATVTASSSPHMGKGYYQFSGMQGAGGGALPDIALIPRWDVRWFVRQSPGLLAVVLGNAKAAFHMPIFYLENGGSAVYRQGSPDKAFGRPVSLTARPTIITGVGTGVSAADAIRVPSGGLLSYGCAPPTCMVTSIGSPHYAWMSVQSSSNTVNQWDYDLAHRRGNFFAAYLATGKYVYLEGMYNDAAVAIAYHTAGLWGNEGRWRGVIYSLGNSPRSSAWGTRTIAWAATFGIDGSVEQAYHRDRLNDTLEMTRGRLNINRGNRTCAGFNPATESDPWKVGRCYFEADRAVSRLGMYMGQWQGESACFCDISPAGGYAYSNWQHEYVMVVLNHLLDLGWDVKPILSHTAKYVIGLVADSAIPSPYYILSYYLPGMNGNDTEYIQDWSTVVAHKPWGGGMVSKPIGTSTTPFTAYSFARISSTAGDNIMTTTVSNDVAWLKIDDEIVRTAHPWSETAAAVSAVDAAEDRLTATGHGYADGDVTLVTGTLDGGMTGGANCGMNRTGQRLSNCWFYVKALDGNTVELYTDSALTKKVNLTGSAANMALRRIQINIEQRGQFGTAVAPHSPGAPVVTLGLGGYDSIFPRNGASGAHAVYHASGLAAAVDIEATATDSKTGATISARRAFEIFDGVMRYKDRLGGGVNCVGLNADNCDNPVWGMRPRHQVKDVMYESGALYYTAPTGDACKVGISRTPFASTDDSADTRDQQVIAARAFDARALEAGSHHYRITCGPGSGTARVSGSFTVSAQ